MMTDSPLAFQLNAAANAAHEASCPGEEALFGQIADSLERDGYAVLPAALPETVSDSLLECLALLHQREFHQATVGRGRDQMRNRFVRRDKIHWIDEELPASEIWLAWSARLRRYLNSRLYLGLFSFESHFSRYDEGDFYRRHVDAFKGESNRVLSLITYLNKGWEPDQGGELLLCAPDSGEELLKVVPGFGTLVLFLSEEFPHEVLPTRRERYAVAGWYRINNSVNASIDPPR